MVGTTPIVLSVAGTIRAGAGGCESETKFPQLISLVEIVGTTASSFHRSPFLTCARQHASEVPISTYRILFARKAAACLKPSWKVSSEE
jgi:hypothetical protein